ncbi:MAG TPA: circularly permuted type 2 ATP-grasp protein [Hyphomicrobiaceae bacterium]|nr:circularly permuted type 2 ATP-grasp protein [Hyphomicrobiaceae bacterium]
MSRDARAAELRGGDLAKDYRVAGGGFDELTEGSGAFRPHWDPLLQSLEALDPANRARRMEQLNARVRETGIAYDLFSDPTSTTQPWRVDLVPLVIPANEWQGLERALIQRARLFEGVLADLYGPQRLLASGAIPHQLVFSDPSFLRPCQNLRPTGGYIQFFATDLARGPDGRWRVIDTHTETPAGIGYALANRMVHTNVAGDIFAACRALRLAPFFLQLRAALARRADRVDPTIALLTPGPRHNDFFSHAYLARYLGLLLVEGADLRVADDRVSLKTLRGLMPVDLIVRCVAGALADPLELDASDFAGPVGLLQVVRRHPDLVVNALGSALVENRGLSAYLPELARKVLGEELLIADGPRWWLGDAANRDHALANIERMVIRPAHEGTARPGRAIPGIDPARLHPDKLEALRQEIEIRGASLVAEAKVGFGTTPSLTAAGLVPKPYALRVFVTSTSEGFAVLPGGLAMTVDPDQTVALSAPDGESRDVWVVSDVQAPPFTSLWRPTIEAARIERTPQDLPSRAADNLFWLGRYIERADWTLRVLRICLSRLQEDSAPRQDLRACRTVLEILLSKEDGKIPGEWEPINARLIEQLAHNLLTSSELHYGLPRTLDNIHRLASITRDRLSLEAWRTLNDFYASRRWRADAMPTTIGDSLRLLDDGLRVLAAFHGLTHENMTRNFGWSFLDMGRRLSRAKNLAELLLGVFGKAASGEDESGSLLFTLELADSFITYRSRYRLEPMLPLVLDLLLIDESNPRSIAFQLAELARHIDALPQSGDGGGRIEEQRMALSLLSSVRLADVVSLAKPGQDGARTTLQHLLYEEVSTLAGLSDVIGRRYFNLLDKGVKWVRARSRDEP